MVIPDFGIIEGAFQVTSIEYAGSHNGEATYELSLAIVPGADLYGGLSAMANPWTGEVALVIDGSAACCKLTLGALAELEAALGADRLMDLGGAV